MPNYIYKCIKCETVFEKRIAFSAAKPVDEVDPDIVCSKCGNAGCPRQMSTGVRGWDGIQEPWEYDYTHKTKPKFVKDSQGNRHKFDPNKHSQGRKGSG